MKKPLMILIIIILLIILNVVMFMEPFSNKTSSSSPATVIKETTSTGKALIGGSFTLTNQDGKRVSDKDFLGKTMVVFFGFTNCPAICPTGLNNLSTALQELGDDASKVSPIFVTVDIERDSPEEIKTYLSNFHPSISGLTGSQKEIDDILKKYRAYAKKVETEMMGTMFDHSTFVYIMDKKGNYQRHMKHNVSGEEMAKTIKEYL